ncbi:MAG: hypothetical protein OZSIB_3427 [Candidatus Ozemobacter sibiricus]|uniref:Uncharacterized protein n=1 Tax=Candidatus Ozemobacter sibiricus TaxID=2268124 RepID=A0A367ZQ26_9BACT|nr:MAG: hypothetical protein OZSIB_3427 [Candidatus Ozemobacter sibiricus]
MTLTEIMFSFLILVLATLAASGLLSYGHRGTAKDFRMVAATQILTDRMNRLLKLPYASHSAEIEPPENPRNFGPTTDGTYHDIPYGVATFTMAGNFQVGFTLEHLPVTFAVQPFLLSNDYDPGIASSYRFAATIDPSLGQFNSADRASRNFYRVIRITVRVTWTEPNGVARSVEAVSFKADLQGA